MSHIAHMGLDPMETIGVRAKEIEAILGGRRVLGSDAIDELIREGFPIGTVEAVRARVQVPQAWLLSVLALSRRTWSRRQSAGRLAAFESDRLYRAARVLAIAEQVLGGQEEARHWITQPNRALGERVPFQLLDTEPGAREVEVELGRIAHGVFR